MGCRMKIKAGIHTTKGAWLIGPEIEREVGIKYLNIPQYRGIGSYRYAIVEDQKKFIIGVLKYGIEFKSVDI